jgi:hypothetical protein
MDNNASDTLTFENFSVVSKAEFTASIDKWQSDGMGDWMDGPSIKLYSKDILDDSSFQIFYATEDYTLNESSSWEMNQKTVLAEFDNSLNLIKETVGPNEAFRGHNYAQDTPVGLQGDVENNLVFFIDNEDSIGSYDSYRLGLHNFDDGSTTYFNEQSVLISHLKVLNLGGSNSLLIYQSGSYADGTNGPASYGNYPRVYADFYGRVFNNDTGEMLSDEVQLTHSFGNKWLSDIQVNLDLDIGVEISEVGIDLSMKDGHPGHKHKPDMDKGSYELRVEHTQETDGAIDIDDVMGVLALSRGIKQTSGKEHELAADWNGDGLIDIDDVMGVLARSRGIRKDDEWRFHDKDSNTSLWDNATKTNKMDIELDGDNEIELSAILRGDVNSSYDASTHNRAPEVAPAPNPAPLPLNNDDELLIINPDIV